MFAPDWGKNGNRIWELTTAAQTGELSNSLELMLTTSKIEKANLDDARLQFSASLLKDIIRAGGHVWVRDSRLLVSWPEWEGPQGRRNAQAAMAAAREIRPLNSAELTRVQHMFAPDLDGDQLAQVLAEADFELCAASAIHPTGVSYGEAFSAALRYWTMPYRGRTGRMRRFVLTANHNLLGPHPVVAGILELGDEAPFCTWRDDLLGLSTSSLLEWVALNPTRNARLAAKRLRSIRKCLRPTSRGRDLASLAFNKILAAKQKIEEQSHGRSIGDSYDGGERLKNRKRLIYGLRLARGEFALTEISDGERVIDVHDSDLGAGVRALHDIFLPRLHMEATICGAVPPFAEAYGGKLLASFLTHPDIIAAPLNSENGLISWSFDMKRLARIMPAHGMLCLTTKGIYAGHAAIYNRASAPGSKAPVRMEHLANTEGTTTTLLSTNTMQLARKVLDAASGKRVSMVYGTGGAKRHRSIESALRLCGLSTNIGLAGIRRPVYGLRFAANPVEVCWAGADPTWRIEPHQNGREFCQKATELWRSRWLCKAIHRIRDYAVTPSLISTSETCGLRVDRDGEATSNGLP